MDRVSDRERAHLRGAVKTVVDGSTKTEYDRLGNILSWRTAHRHAVAERCRFFSHSYRKSLET